MKISIIVPIYNLDCHIEKCLDSIANQDFSVADYEVLIVLDSCTDKSEEVVAAWTQKFPAVNVKLFRADCKNPGGARNVALDNAVGEYLCFLDGDDWFNYSTALSEMVQTIGDHTVLRMAKFAMNEASKILPMMRPLWAYFFKRSFVGKERLQEGHIGEEVEFMKTLQAKSDWSESVLEDRALYYYNSPRSGSILTERFPNLNWSKMQRTPPKEAEILAGAKSNA